MAVSGGRGVAGQGPDKRGARRRLGRAVALLFLAVLIGLTVAFWSWVDAQARALVLISSVLDAPVVTPVAEAVSGEPRFEDVPVGGHPTLVARPAGEGPWPAVFFVNGTVREGRELPEVRRLAEGFARAGYLVFVPDLPGLTEDRITAETLEATIGFARRVSDRPGVHGEEVALVGVSTGATLALLAAEDPALEGRVSLVAGVAPYGDIRTVLNVATTGHYRRDGGKLVAHDADPFLSYVVARSLVAALPAGEDRRTLSAELWRIDRGDPRPLSQLRDRSTADLGPEARSVVELLANENPERFDRLCAALPEEVRGDLEVLSPLEGTGRIRAPIEIATGPRDEYFPASESYELRRIAPQRRVTLTRAIDHAEIRPSLDDVPAFAKFDGFVVRALREAMH